jgi:hypothetical protein
MGHSTQSPVPTNPQAYDNPYCAQCCQAVEFLFDQGGGGSDTLSLKMIMSGKTLYYKNRLSLQIRKYCQLYEEYNPRNSQIAHTKGAISLVPIRNLQGGFNFMALNTQKRLFTAVGIYSYA